MNGGGERERGCGFHSLLLDEDDETAVRHRDDNSDGNASVNQAGGGL